MKNSVTFRALTLLGASSLAASAWAQGVAPTVAARHAIASSRM